MSINQRLTALYTMFQFEVVRMSRVSFQVFLPPIVTTLLYFLIFSSIIGQRIGPIDGVDYGLYIAPGLLMLAVINNVYSNVATSLFIARFQKFIEELLVSPMSNMSIMCGYVLGGLTRGLIVAALVLCVEFVFVDLHLRQLPLVFLIIILSSILFSLIGFTNGMIAQTFEGITVVPVFLLTPLIYLGGVFYSIKMLPSFWQAVGLFNPIFHIISAARDAMIGGARNTHLWATILAMFIACLITGGMNLMMLKKGVGLRN